MPRTLSSRLQSDSADASTSQSEGGSNRRNWNHEETIFFLELLLEVKRDGRLNTTKAANLREVLNDRTPLLVDEFPGRQWGKKSVENRYHVKGYWRAFCYAADESGTSYNPDNGKLPMIKQNEGKGLGSLCSPWPGSYQLGHHKLAAVTKQL